MSWEIEKSLITSEEHNEDPKIDENFDVDADTDEFSFDDDSNVGESNIDGNSDIDEFDVDTNIDDWWNEDSDIDDFNSEVDFYEFDLNGVENMTVVSDMTIMSDEMSNIEEFNIEENERLVRQLRSELMTLEQKLEIIKLRLSSLMAT